MVQCEEGWSYIAEWMGVPLSQVLQTVEVHPQARYVIWLRDGYLFNWSSENEAGRATIPSTESRQSANPPA